MGKKVSGKREFKEREIIFGKNTSEKHVPNVIKNQKYNIITFVPFVSILLCNSKTNLVDRRTGGKSIITR